MARSFGISGMAGITKYINLAVKLITFQYVGMALGQVSQQLPAYGGLVNVVGQLGLTVGRISVIKKALKLPFGLSALIGGMLSISSIMAIMSSLPQILNMVMPTTYMGGEGSPQISEHVGSSYPITSVSLGTTLPVPAVSAPVVSAVASPYAGTAQATADMVTSVYQQGMTTVQIADAVRAVYGSQYKVGSF